VLTLTVIKVVITDMIQSQALMVMLLKLYFQGIKKSKQPIKLVWS